LVLPKNGSHIPQIPDLEKKWKKRDGIAIIIVRIENPEIHSEPSHGLLEI
jgi:hypothetical protein